MPYADINQQRIYFEDSGGGGRPVILAHGFLMDHSMFDPQVAALAPELRVIRFDERGFGRTETDGRPFTYWDLAADCIGLLDHLGIERAVVGGMSQGGFLSIRAALAQPERVKALVLISTDSGKSDETASKAVLDVQQIWPHEEILQGVATQLLGEKPHWEPWISRWREHPKARLVEPSRCLIERDDVTPRLGEITCPTLVIHGTADLGFPLAGAERLCRALPNCKGFVAVEGAAHAPSLTHADQVNPPLLDFLRAYA